MITCSRHWQTQCGLFIALLLILAACSSTPRRGPSSLSDFEPNPESNQHPASYFIDRFTVEKERPQRASESQPFFFKRCYAGGQRAPYSATSYDCDYTF